MARPAVLMARQGAKVFGIDINPDHCRDHRGHGQEGHEGGARVFT